MNKSSNEPGGSTGGREQGGWKNDTPCKRNGKDRINLWTTSMRKAGRDSRKKPEGPKPVKGKFKKQYCLLEKCYGRASALSLIW